jgi:hypothetical protein
MLTQLPLIIQNQFKETYDGFKAARFKSVVETHNLEIGLRKNGCSFQTKIIKSKKRGREFLVLLVDKE